MSCAELEQALAALLPAQVAFAVQDPRAQAVGLYPDEAAAVARAVPKRRREFAAGRRAARAALARLGQAPAPIPSAPSRAPLWPRGFVGSISHCDDLCLAVCARSDDILSLGCDIEARAPLPEGLWDAITTAKERDWLRRCAALLPIDVFSAKEAAFKALYPITQKMLGFQDLSLSPQGAGRVCAELQAAAGACAAGARVPLLSARLKAHILFVSILTAPP